METAIFGRARDLLLTRFGKAPLAYVHSFGCQQNQSDGEKLKGLLAEMGFSFCDNPQDADMVLYNTCAVRENAEDRVLGHIGALKPLKEARPEMLIGLCGCMPQQEVVSARIRKSYPYVDLVFGTHALHTLPTLLLNRLQGQKRQFSTADADGEIYEGLPLVRDSSVFANLPIMYGCDNFCSYCIVPYVRGRERSRMPQQVLEEARSLVAAGYKDITLLGQNVNSYGKGLPVEVDFADLLSMLDSIDGEYRLRFMTSHPKDCSEKLLDVIAASKHIPHHLHLPVQSGNDRVLSVMNRRYTRADYLAKIEYARRVIPDITFSSDIIVGFPGETYDEFLDTLSLVEQVRYSGLFTFLYSRRTGTKAADFPDPVSDSEKGKWFRQLLDVQHTIRDESQQALIGKTLRVLCDGVGKSAPGMLSGRTDANDIVEFSGGTEQIGAFLQVRIQRALNWAAFGTIAANSEKSPLIPR